jgi:hypothetical protein
VKLLDPARPKLSNGLPMYPWDHPVAVIPALALNATENGWRVDVMLSVGPGAFRWFIYYVQLEELPNLMLDWLEDPEQVMREYFGWDQDKELPGLTLADLGL